MVKKKIMEGDFFNPRSPAFFSPTAMSCQPCQLYREKHKHLLLVMSYPLHNWVTIQIPTEISSAMFVHFSKAAECIMVSGITLLTEDHFIKWLVLRSSPPCKLSLWLWQAIKIMEWEFRPVSHTIYCALNIMSKDSCTILYSGIKK